MSQSYVVEASKEEGIEKVLSFAERELAMARTGTPDIVILRYHVCSIDNARKVLSYASQTGTSGQKLIVLASERLFHEAQNALLKVCEEPPQGTTLVLVVPSLGMLLPTLRSRLLLLPGTTSTADAGITASAEAFLHASSGEREKMVKKLLDRSKSDKDAEKQAARIEAQELISGITKAVHRRWRAKGEKEYEVLLNELATFTPMLYERSAPLKLIFEHVLLTVPKI